MTLKEAKDQVANKIGYETWLRLHQEIRYDKVQVESMCDEAAELYARSKWDEACTLTNRNIIHHTSLNLGDLPAKPEFKQ